jgi:hypothetical protein
MKVIFDNGAAPASVRLRAADRLLRHMKGLVRIGELEGRLRNGSGRGSQPTVHN